MALYTLEISSEDTLSERWKDPNHPTKSFKFNEKNLEECVQLENGNYSATYNTVEYGSPVTLKYINESGSYTATIPAGEYGIRP
tara:strand:+ start:1745 stop:1996 length:252 start_codon:yes stop_codon:yes gene_type:complete